MNIITNTNGTATNASLVYNEVRYGLHNPVLGGTLKNGSISVAASDVETGIDLGEGKSRYNTIQVSGKTTSSSYEFLLQYSLDNTNWYGTDGITPQLTQDGSDYGFSLTRTDICHRYVRIKHLATGASLHLQYNIARH